MNIKHTSLHTQFLSYANIILLCFATGPFVSALANRYGFRIVTILGAIIACLSFVASSFATSIEFLCITYGVLGGKLHNFNARILLLDLRI